MGQGAKFARFIRKHFADAFAFVVVLLCALALAPHLGCSAAQWKSIEHDAEAVQYVTSPRPVASPAITPATTRPTTQQVREQTVLDISRVAAQTAGSASPPFMLILTALAAVAGGVATIAKGRQAAAANDKAAAAQDLADTAHNAIGEIVGDVAQYVAPDQAWSSDTEQLLLALGHAAAAAIIRKS